MGSNLSPILAEIVVNTIIKYSLDRLQFDVPFLHQYVDDIICSVPHDSIDLVLQCFNSFNEHLQFTVERETDNSVPFLDTLVVRDNGNILKLDWYRKSTSSGRYLNFHSHHDLQHKINVVLGMKRRILNISHPDYHSKNFTLLKSILKSNGYPVGPLNHLINSNSPRRPVNLGAGSGGDPVIYKSLIHIDGLTVNLRRIISRHTNVKVTESYTNTLKYKFYSRLKDKTPLLYTSNVIYRIPCSRCPLVYIGQTSQRLKSRIIQHKSDCRLKPKSCGLAAHFNNADHAIDYENVSTLCTENNTFQRCFLEMCHIYNAGETMNNNKDIDNLSCMYHLLLPLSRNRFSFEDI